jgi:integrase
MKIRDDLRCERSKLREFVERVIVPALERNGASKSHIERHNAAVEYVERFVKEPLDPGDIDAQLVLNFDAWLWRKGISDSRRRDLVESLRRIAAAYTPDRKRCRTNRSTRRVLPEPIAGSLRHYYETVYVVIHLLGRTARYVDENRATLWRLYEHYGRDLLLTEFTDALIAQHVAYLLEQGLKPATINTGHVAVIRAILRHAYERGLVERVPKIRNLAVEQNQPDSWSAEQVAAFIEAASPRPIAGIDAGDWWECATRILWYSGIRRRTLLAIRRSPPDVDLETGWLRVPGSAMKNRKGKPFRLGEDCLESIARIWDPARPLLLPFPFDKGVFYDQFHRIREAAGLPLSNANMGCIHKLRRSCATAVAAKLGLEGAREAMGHSSIATTRRYVDPTKIPGADLTSIVGALPRRKNRSQNAGL